MTRLYLDDLQVGQRFVSQSHVVDKDQIVRFAREFDPQPFHLDEDGAKQTVFGSWLRAGGTPRPLRCAFLPPDRFNSSAEPSDWGLTNCAGQQRFAPETSFAWKPKSWRCARRDRNRVRV